MSNIDSTWESLRPSDGSSLTISFDWNEDHSSWRLEELSNEITEAMEILETSGHTTDRPTSIYDLDPITSLLRRLHRGEAVTDATVRRALALADQLELGDIASDDANFQYESLIEHVTELIEAWDRHNTWIYIDDEWDVTAQRLFDRCREHRNGLGDRWRITFDDDSIELPDGTVVYGLRPLRHQVKLFDEIVIDFAYVDEQDHAGIAKAVMNLDATAADVVGQAVCDLAAGRRMEIDTDVANTIIRIVQHHDIDALEKVIDTASRLADQWAGSETELICAAEALLVN